MYQMLIEIKRLIILFVLTIILFCLMFIEPEVQTSAIDPELKVLAVLGVILFFLHIYIQMV